MSDGKTFTAVDQARFADCSGDRNPLHMDTLAARRTAAGTPVVHGVHTLIWLLDQLAPACKARAPARIAARFIKFIPVGAEIHWRIVHETWESLSAVVTLAGIPVLTLALGWTAKGNLAQPAMPTSTLDFAAAANAPIALDWTALEDLGGTVAAYPGYANAAHAFPAAAALLPRGALAGLLATTRLVGMVCPGLHSIFSELDIAFTPGEAAPAVSLPAAADLRWNVRSSDARFRTVVLAVASPGMVGALRTFMRPPPVAQPSVAALSPLLRAGEFQGATALVVGGSRGLGELTAKLLAAGGADSVITYAAGEDDAAGVAADVQAAGRSCSILRVDATRPLADQMSALPVGITHAYYFATSKIFRQGVATFDPAAFASFTRLYVDAFEELCSQVAACAGARSTRVFYPSSIAVETRPRGMTEYAMAKAAGEALCHDIDRCMPGIEVVIRRLPRLLTDQTATTSPVRTEDAAAVMLEVVRAMHAPCPP